MTKKNPLTLDDLARMTQNQFDATQEQIDQRFQTVGRRFDVLEQGQNRLEKGLQHVLHVILEIPTKKAFEKLVHKVEDIDDRLTVVERKTRTL